MQSFEYSTSPSRVIFGRGTLQTLPDELARQHLTAPLLLSGPRQVKEAENLEAILNGRTAGLFAAAKMHTPLQTTEEVLEYMTGRKPDCIVAVGGGSAIGLGKAISIRTGLPHICLPTTYSGSEMTSTLGETVDGQKKRRTDPKLRPGTVIYDVDLTMNLPVSTSMVSGINAMAHAVEALYGPNANPITSLLAQEGIRVLAGALPIILETPSSEDARWQALYGAWLCGSCLGNVDMGLHHKLCHIFGGSFDLPHAETHAVVLAHALAYNAPEIPQAMEQLAQVLPDSDGDAIRGLNVLLTKLKVSRSLRDFGMRGKDINKATEIALSNPYKNPRKIEKEPLGELIRRCWAGEEARADF